MMEQHFPFEYDSQFIHNVKFSNDGVNCMSIDDLLQYLDYNGDLPITALSNVYMRIVDVGDVVKPSMTREEIFDLIHEELRDIQGSLTVEEVRSIVKHEVNKMAPSKLDYKSQMVTELLDLKKAIGNIKQEFNEELEELKERKREAGKIINTQVAKITSCAESLQRKTARANAVQQMMPQDLKNKY